MHTSSFIHLRGADPSGLSKLFTPPYFPFPVFSLISHSFTFIFFHPPVMTFYREPEVTGNCCCFHFSSTFPPEFQRFALHFSLALGFSYVLLLLYFTCRVPCGCDGQVYGIQVTPGLIPYPSLSSPLFKTSILHPLLLIVETVLSWHTRLP